MSKLKQAILQEDREKAVEIAIDLLESGTSVLDLYNESRDALYSIECKEGDKHCIWREHIKTAIVRTIIEVSFPYVLKEAKTVDKKHKTVLVVCPPEEYHEIGAKMAHDFFVLSGYQSIFVGANTPLDVILDALEFTKPDYVAISVTNYYNIIKAKEIIQAIKDKNPNTTVLAGGQAFDHKDAFETVEADIHLKDFEGIKDL